MVLCWQVSAACGKCIKIIMTKVINMINPQWVGVVRVSGYGFFLVLTF
jgi:NADPH-dependent 7-cyano-7-deazaguanine reductase QueF